MPPPADERYPPSFIESLIRLDAHAWNVAFEELRPIALQAIQQGNTRLSPQDAEEVVNDTLVDLAPRLRDFTAWSQLTAFVYVAARRRSIDRLRRLRAKKRHDGRADPVSVDDMRDELIAENAAVFAKWSEISSVLDSLIDSLGDPAATLLRGYIEEGLSYEELAQRSNRPVGTVASIIHRNLRRLKGELDRSSKISRELSLYLNLLLL